jgi:hypothetical protein
MVRAAQLRGGGARRGIHNSYAGVLGVGFAKCWGCPGRGLSRDRALGVVVAGKEEAAEVVLPPDHAVGTDR